MAQAIQSKARRRLPRIASSTFLLALFCVASQFTRRAQAQAGAPLIESKKFSYTAVFYGKAIWLETQARREVFSSSFAQGAEAMSILLGARLNATTVLKMEKRWNNLALTAEMLFENEYDAAKVLMVIANNQELVYGEMVDSIGEMFFTDIRAPKSLYEYSNGT